MQIIVETEKKHCKFMILLLFAEKKLKIPDLNKK